MNPPNLRFRTPSLHSVSNHPCHHISSVVYLLYIITQHYLLGEALTGYVWELYALLRRQSVQVTIRQNQRPEKQVEAATNINARLIITFFHPFGDQCLQ